MLRLSSIVIALTTLATYGVKCLADTPDFESGDSPEPQNLANVYYNCTVPNTVALTFDDGPYIYEKDLVDILKSNNIKATFFVNGDNYRCIYDDDIISSLRYTYEAGMLVGGHTWSHANLTQLNASALEEEFAKIDLALKRILGIEAAYTRPPYGEFNDTVRAVAATHHQQLVMWDFDSGDSIGKTPEESKELYRNLTQQHPPSILTLNHETHNETVYNVIPYAIEVLKDAGYQFATVSECLGLPDYVSVGEPEEKDDSWQC